MKQLFAVLLFLAAAAATTHTALPKKIMDAKTVAVIGRLGAIGAGGYTPDPRRAKEQICTAIEKWGRFTIVDDPAKADLILIVTESHMGSMLVSSGSGTETYHSSVTQEISILGDVLSVYPGGTVPDEKAEPLWYQIERGGYSWPANRAIGKFKKDVEAAAKEKKSSGAAASQSSHSK